MKKFFTVILSTILCLIALFGSACASRPDALKVNIKYYANGDFVVDAIVGGSETIGLVAEPLASTLEANYLTQAGKALYRLDLQELYDGNTKAYPQAVLMVKKSVLSANPNLIDTLENKIAESVSWVKQNTFTAVETINSKGGNTLDAGTLTDKDIDGCKIYWESAQNSKTSVKNYIDKIVEIDSTKASAVADDFFYLEANATPSQQSAYTFMAPDGAPAIAIAKLINDKDSLGTGKTIDYSVIKANQVVANLSSGTPDFIIAPVNLASKLYKANGNDYVMVSVITHGNFYILSTTEISVNDLKGKQVAVPNQGAVPDWTFKMVLDKYGLLYTTVE